MLPAAQNLISVLPIFPERGLDQSILIAVLIGVYVLLFFTEVFGWVWAGLVVPGYLASVFVVQPAAGIAVVVEGVITFVIVRFLSDRMASFGVWSPLIGRERFFVVVLVSVVVRQVSELWLLEFGLTHLDGLLGTHLASSHDFSSVGLVLVPLLANMFWKLDVKRGLFQTGVAVLIVYALLRLLILPGTNLSFANLELTYENVALDFLGSPKAYIIMVTGSYLAAQYNLDYGWDYNGILVPSLLALTWFEPSTLITTIVEAMVLLYVTKAVLTLPLFKNMNLEGPRKVTVVFTVGFVLKFILAWVVWLWLPDVEVSQLFGFGYVLTSLLAVKMLNLKKVGRVMLPAVQVSLVSFVAGSAVGFVLDLVAPKVAPRAQPQHGVASSRALTHPQAALAWSAVRAVRELPRPMRQGRSASELSSYAKLWQGVDAWLEGEGDAGLVNERAEAVGLVLRPMAGANGPAWFLFDPEEDLTRVSGWDSAMIFPDASGPVLEVPRPRHDEWSVPLAWALCARVQCRAILVSGVDGDDASSAAASTAHPRATLLVAHRELRRQSIVQVRQRQGDPILHLRHSIPARVSLGDLWPTPVELSWTEPPMPILQWQEDAEFAVLRVPVHEAIALIAHSAPALPTSMTSVRDWFVAWEGQHQLWQLSASELRILEKMIVEPIMLGAQPAAVAALAEALGYRLQWLYDQGPGDLVLGLRGHFAAAVIRPGGQPIVLEVPRGFVEQGAASTAFMLWRQGSGRALVFARSVRDLPWHADVATGVFSEFQAMHQALDRTLPAGSNAVIAAMRGVPQAFEAAESGMSYVGLGTPTITNTSVPAAASWWLTTQVSPLLGRLAYASSDADSRDLLGVGSPQLAFSRALPRVAVMQIWLSNELRQAMRNDEPATWQLIAARAGMPWRRVSMYFDTPRHALALAPSAIDPAVTAAVASYQQSADIASLSRMLAATKRRGATLAWDVADAVPWLVVPERGTMRWYPLMGARTCPQSTPARLLVAQRCAFEVGRHGP
ncbi:MAG: poly-gamma-glutamate biosynthesis protein PgsC/CapC [Myxococcales bacterium]|nr:poly-gamma-glutamate biosynthesis protein PgsC/CapC [Myxococcales bacterium]